MQIIDDDGVPTVVLNGTNHVIEKLNENCKYYIDQFQDLNLQLTQLKAKMHQVEVARAGFSSLLQVEIDALERTFKEEAGDGEEEDPTES